ncbi:hypothetical protein DFQ28_006070 [Apophysomyces sp. BC1034]|nr:hypothetical protein DFQ28_006070 [Apophysomyces sp. BC1034]
MIDVKDETDETSLFISPPVASDGSVTAKDLLVSEAYRPVDSSRTQKSSWYCRLGSELWNQRMEERRDRVYLKNLPKGYALVLRLSSRDKYVVGHPSGNLYRTSSE